MINLLGKLVRELRGDFWGTLAAWQDQRPLWLLGGLTALGLEIFSWAWFQNYLGLRPCELCVYIRFSMVAICLGAALAALKPDHPWLKLGGYVISIWGMLRGLRWNIALELDYLKAAENPWSIICSPAEVRYPFDLPLHQWLPGHFEPTAGCGEDAWSLFGLNMAEWLFLVYGVFLLGITLMLISWLRQAYRRRVSK